MRPSITVVKQSERLSWFLEVESGIDKETATLASEIAAGEMLGLGKTVRPPASCDCRLTRKSVSSHSLVIDFPGRKLRENRAMMSVHTLEWNRDEERK
jgi:hypothetical protein